MTGLRIDLADPATCESPREYIEKHLAPVLTELHRITNELLAPGATSAEEWATDMVPHRHAAVFSRLDARLDDSPKHVVFDGSQYFSVSKKLLRAKRPKVQLTAVLYLKVGAGADFRLVSDNGDVIQGSLIHVDALRPQEYSVLLPFGEAPGCVTPDSQVYYLEARCLDKLCVPVCRRFSLSFVYI